MLFLCTKELCISWDILWSVISEQCVSSNQFIIFMTAPVTAFFYNMLIFLGFMAFFIWVIMRRFCLRPEPQEYIGSCLNILGRLSLTVENNMKPHFQRKA